MSPLSIFKKRTRVQDRPDTRSYSEIAQDRYTKMEIQLQSRCTHLRNVIDQATADLADGEAVLASIHAAQASLKTELASIEPQIMLNASDLMLIDETDPSMPMGEHGNRRID